MCAGARTSTANGRVGAKCIHCQVRATQIYTVLTSKRSPQNPIFFLQLYIIASIVLIRELSWDSAAGAALPFLSLLSIVSFIYSLLIRFFFFQFHQRAPLGTAPYVALMINRHSLLFSIVYA